MRLDFSGAPEIRASPDHVWTRLMDHEFVASCAPGVESVEAVDDTHFKVTSGLGVGKMKLRFQLDVELFDIEPPHSAKMSVRGKTPGSAVQFDCSVHIKALAGNRTLLKWDAETRIHGKIASVGARLMRNTARKLTDTFWQKFAEGASAV